MEEDQIISHLCKHGEIKSQVESQGQCFSSRENILCFVFSACVFILSFYYDRWLLVFHLLKDKAPFQNTFKF